MSPQQRTELLHAHARARLPGSQLGAALIGAWRDGCGGAAGAPARPPVAALAQQQAGVSRCGSAWAIPCNLAAAPCPARPEASGGLEQQLRSLSASQLSRLAWAVTLRRAGWPQLYDAIAEQAWLLLGGAGRQQHAAPGSASHGASAGSASSSTSSSHIGGPGPGPSPRFQAGELPDLLWALAMARHQARPLCHRAARHMARHARQLRAGDLALALWALARLGCPDPVFTEVALQAVVEAARRQRALLQAPRGGSGGRQQGCAASRARLRTARHAALGGGSAAGGAACCRRAAGLCARRVLRAAAARLPSGGRRRWRRRTRTRRWRTRAAAAAVHATAALSVRTAAGWAWAPAAAAAAAAAAPCLAAPRAAGASGPRGRCAAGRRCTACPAWRCSGTTTRTRWRRWCSCCLCCRRPRTRTSPGRWPPSTSRGPRRPRRSPGWPTGGRAGGGQGAGRGGVGAKGVHPGKPRAVLDTRGADVAQPAAPPRPASKQSPPPPKHPPPPSPPPLCARRAQEQLAAGALPRRHLGLLAWAFAAAGLQQPAAWEALSSALLSLGGGALAGAMGRAGLTQLYQAYLAQAATLTAQLYLPAAGLGAARAAYLSWASSSSHSEREVMACVRCAPRPACQRPAPGLPAPPGAAGRAWACPQRPSCWRRPGALRLPPCP
jgi:hypothetical protein